MNEGPEMDICAMCGGLCSPETRDRATVRVNGQTLVFDTADCLNCFAVARARAVELRDKKVQAELHPTSPFHGMNIGYFPLGGGE